MEKFVVEIVETRIYSVEIEASDESDAIEKVRDFDSDELEEYEVDVSRTLTA